MYNNKYSNSVKSNNNDNKYIKLLKINPKDSVLNI